MDHFGHLVIDCYAGEERTGTGLRGLPSLMQNGLMVKPAQFHVDPMQRHVEIDGVRFECNESGARELEAALNARYAPALKDASETAVEVRENPASPSGFDLRFVVLHAGARFEVKGHLSQEKLDILQDQSKCSLLRPGILLRVVPPFLLVRRRRPDGGEEKVPELPDLQYLRATAVQVQAMLNHPVVRRGSGPAVTSTAAAEAPELAELRIRRNPQNKLCLWLEFVMTDGDHSEGRAFTHHNLAELQHRGTFLPHLEAILSLDNRHLSLFDRQSNTEQHLTLDPASSDDDLHRAGQMLTAALRPPKPRAPLPATTDPTPCSSPPPTAVPSIAAPFPAADPSNATTAPMPTDSAVAPPWPPTAVPPLPAPGTTPDPLPLPPSSSTREPPASEAQRGKALPAAKASTTAEAAEATPPQATLTPEPDDFAWLSSAPPQETLRQVFQALVVRTGLPVQDVALSLPPAFANRRFEILSFGDQPIESVLELRSENFAGFYLTHLHDADLLLVYAHGGRHIEFGAKRCELQASTAAEPEEFKGAGLLGVAQDPDGAFVFVVTAAYRGWLKTRDLAYRAAAARFVAPAELARNEANLDWIWPPDGRTAS
jgi:hypothetical protein